MNKNRLVQIAYHLMLRNRDLGIQLTDLTHVTRLGRKEILDFFPIGEQELWMDAMEYGGRKWIASIQMEVGTMDTPMEKMRMLISRYVLGSKDWPDALSLYIDLWKKIKDGGNAYLRDRLRNIYAMYTDAFVDMSKDICKKNMPEDCRDGLALLCTVLSDALHIQRITLESEMNFSSVQTSIDFLIDCVVERGGESGTQPLA